MIKERGWDASKVLITSQDEGRFGRINIPKRCWCEKPKRPKIHKQVVRQAVYTYLVVCPEKEKVSCLILPHANTSMMNLFLQQVAEDFEGYKLIMQVDRAAWHMSKELKVPDNIALIPQPPYSPQLNPVECIWAEIREKFLDNKLFQSMENLMDELERALVQISNYGNRLKSMTNFLHLKNAIQN